MKKKASLLLVVVVTITALFCAGIAAAQDVTDADYKTTVTIGNNGTAAANVFTTFSLNTTDMITGGMLNATANDTVMLGGGQNVAHMPGWGGNPWITYVESIGATATMAQYLYHGGALGGNIAYFPGAEGMSANHSATLELGDNFTIEQSGWVDTSAGANKYLVDKTGAFRVAVSPDTDGEIEVWVKGSDKDCLDFLRPNGDWVRIPDDDAFSFTDGAGNDEPFTLMMWANLDDATGSAFMTKWHGAGNRDEWRLITTGADILQIDLASPNGANSIQATTLAITADQGTWYHYAVSYDGSELNTGLEIYRNGINIVNARGGGGAYVGMTNGTENPNIGASDAGTTLYMDGQMAEVKVYNAELTPTEVVADFNGGHRTADLVAWWQIDEGVGLPQDNSGNAHHATQNLADWVATFDQRLAPIITATSITSGEHIVATTANVTHLQISIDGGLEDSTALTANITVNSGNWTYVEAAAMPIMEYSTITINSTVSQNITWQYATVFTDSSGNGNHATPTFRTTSSDADVWGYVSAVEGLEAQTSPTSNTSGGWTMLGSTPATPENLFDEGGDNYTVGDFDFGARITAWAQNAGYDATSMHLIVAYVCAFVAMALTYGASRKAKGDMAQRGSLTIAAVVGGVVLAVFYRYTTIPGFTLVPYGLISLVIILWRRSPSPVD